MPQGVPFIFAVDDYFGGDISFPVQLIERSRVPGDTCAIPYVISNEESITVDLSQQPYSVTDEGLPDCNAPGEGNPSAAFFLQYTPFFASSEIIISACGGVDSDIHVYDSCGGSCIGYADDNDAGLPECDGGFQASISLIDMPQGVPFIFAVDDYFGGDTSFPVTIVEVRFGDSCDIPLTISSEETVTVDISSRPNSILSEGLDDCGNTGDSERNTIFFSFTPQIPFSNTIISVSDPDSKISAFSGCGSGTCIDFSVNSLSVLTLPADVNVPIIIAVDSPNSLPGSLVDVYLEEIPPVLVDGCLANGGYYEHDDFYLLTTTSCGGAFCAVFEGFDVGFCIDYPGCSCDITSVYGLTTGDLIQAGTYQLSVAVLNGADIAAVRTVNVIVEDACNQEGPSVQCPDEEIVIAADTLCGGRIPCVAFSESQFSFSCDDYETCECSWNYSTDSIIPGEVLYSRRNYILEIEATNSLGASATCISLVTVSSQ